MDVALDAEDAPRFFHAARRALQERLAAQWQMPASRVTIPEIRTRLNGHGEEIRAVFQTADEIAYSGKRFTAPDLQRWRDLVKNTTPPPRPRYENAQVTTSTHPDYETPVP